MILSPAFLGRVRLQDFYYLAEQISNVKKALKKTLYLVGILKLTRTFVIIKKKLTLDHDNYTYTYTVLRLG